MNQYIKTLIFVAIVGAGITAAVFYLMANMKTEQKTLPGNVYDYRKDPELIRVVQTALSLEAVMTRRANVSERGVPEVRYTLDSVNQIVDGTVEVKYRILIQRPDRQEAITKKKKFYRKDDGTWRALRE